LPLPLLLLCSRALHALDFLLVVVLGAAADDIVVVVGLVLCCFSSNSNIILVFTCMCREIIDSAFMSLHLILCVEF